MGLPEILIDFKTQAETAVIRSENGIVALILDDTTKQTLSATYVYEADIPADDWTAKNRDYIKKTFLGTPNKVILERRLNVEDGYAGVLARLNGIILLYRELQIKMFNLCMIGYWSKEPQSVHLKLYFRVQLQAYLLMTRVSLTSRPRKLTFQDSRIHQRSIVVELPDCWQVQQ